MVSHTKRDKRFTVLAGKSLSKQAYDEVRRLLMQGRLKPGERLVSRLLALKLGISTTPVREALYRLVSERALEMDDRNTIVVPVITAERYQEICDLRIHLESFAAERAVEFVTAASIDALAALHAQHVAAEVAGNLGTALEHNERFHFGLCRLAGLTMVTNLVESLWLQCGPTLNLFYAQSASRWPTHLHPHLRVIDGLRRSDAQAVRNAIATDIAEGAEPILSRLRAMRMDCDREPPYMIAPVEDHVISS